MNQAGSCESPMLAADSDPSPSTVSAVDEAAFIRSWDKDTERAARRVARFADRAGADDIDDIIQNIRIRLLLSYRTFQGAPPTGYVRLLIKHTCINAIRDDQARLTQHNKKVAFSLNDDDLNLSDVSEDSAELPDGLIARPQHSDVLLKAAVAGWVAKLPTQLRAVYQAIYGEDRQMSEVALALGVSLPRVSQLHRELIARGKRDLHRLVSA